MLRFARTVLFQKFLMISLLLLISACQEEAIITYTNKNPSNQLSKAATDPDVIILKVIQNKQVYNWDFMLSSGYTENPTGTNYGQFAYGCGEQEESTTDLYRMYNPTFYDHMISVNPSSEDTNWQVESGHISWIWTGQPAWSNSSLEKIRRTYKNTTGDRGATFDGESPSNGYVFDPGWLGFAFKRFGLLRENIVNCSAGTVSGKPVILQSNKVAGGIIWELEWNGKQFLNHWDKDLAGRGIQIDCYIDSDGSDGHESDYNPTEGGDGVGNPRNEPPKIVYPETYELEWRHGSPITKFNIYTNKLETEVLPLLWEPKRFYSDDTWDTQSHPVMWKGKIGKIVETETLGEYNIIKWRSKISKPVGSTENISLVEAISTHLNNEFNKFYIFRESQNTFDNILIPIHSNWNPNPNENHVTLSSKGVIIATTDGNYAIGCYQNFALRIDEGWNLVNETKSGFFDENSFECSKFGLIVKNMTGGDFDETVYLVVGNLQYVKEAIRYLNIVFP